MSSLYLLNAKGTCFYKIGITKKNIEKRISNLQTGCPYKLTLILEIEGNNDTEKELHNEYQNFKEHGEWFKFEDDEIKYVIQYIKSKDKNNPEKYIESEEDLENCWKCGSENIVNYNPHGNYGLNFEELKFLNIKCKKNYFYSYTEGQCDVCKEYLIFVTEEKSVGCFKPLENNLYEKDSDGQVNLS